jgi:hypothetical protein
MTSCARLQRPFVQKGRKEPGDAMAALLSIFDTMYIMLS